MITKELIEYVTQQTQQGILPDDIKNALRSNSWEEADIEQAFVGLVPLQSVSAPAAPVQTVQPVVSTSIHKTNLLVPGTIGAIIAVAGLAYAAIVLTTPASVPAPVTSETDNALIPSLPIASSTENPNIASTSTQVITAESPAETIKRLYLAMRKEIDTITTTAELETVVSRYGDKAQVAKLSGANLAKIEALPQTFKDQMIALVKNPLSNTITITEVTVTGTAATLHARSTMPGFTKGTASYSSENGQWKLGLESWSQ